MTPAVNVDFPGVSLVHFVPLVRCTWWSGGLVLVVLELG